MEKDSVLMNIERYQHLKELSLHWRQVKDEAEAAGDKEAMHQAGVSTDAAQKGEPSH